jgi:16S rRNA (uracil1498-N3)-methyltransferase
MRLHRFFFPFDFNQLKIEIQDKDLVKQIRAVLRLSIGDEFILFDGKLNEFKVKIEKIEKEKIEVLVLEKTKNSAELLLSSKVDLYCAILKKDNFEWAVQKAVEAGVENIFPLITKRTIKISFKRERLEKIIKEAAEQSGRGMIPKISEPLKFSEALKLTKENKFNILFDLRGEPFSAFLGFSPKSHFNVFVGPEGGFEEEEIKAAKELNFKIFSLGPFVLRAESAVLVACYLAKNCFFR